MAPFQSISDIAAWFLAGGPAGRWPCSVLLDNTTIGRGIQRRQIFHDREAWIIGFPGERF